MSSQPIRIATRASGLALWQAHRVADLLRQASPDREVELVHVTTRGDRDQTEPLYEIGTLGVFTREVQNAVLDGRADVAVHSLKDLPTDATAGLTLPAVPERASPYDVLVLPTSQRSTGTADEILAALPLNARVGTGSLRRRAQLLHRRPDLEMLNVRGNVETRLRKLDDGQYDALVLAEAGLRRLGLDGRIDCELRPPLMYPAVSQGALGVECRSDDDATCALLAAINDEVVHAAITAERTLLAELRAGCHAPLGVQTRIAGDRLDLEAVVLSQDGRERLLASANGPRRDPAAVGRQVADELRRQGADRLVGDSR